MQQFEAKLVWERGQQGFADQRYSRAHEWSFDGGLRVPASSSPLSVPPPMSNPANLDPEEALVAAASSCHMLFFLSIAAQRGFVVDRYSDHAVGELARNAEGRVAMTRITLRPSIAFSGAALPDAAARAAIHHLAHQKCYIANSLKTDIVVAEAEG
ncbi:organic hydroperoxide reductase OsmC/OhrA [Janthinobacterium sp. CG_23.3]|uniref:OsmC family protein n=1 Tax=unclassified Janthinobacterium TaxID=2610881 RepID=UPI0003452870|nr:MULTISPECIES: OsmC family protein [unclassified Janthinobacterium]MEC5159191.1 organic hydroperoxide reductase OsmC/OhrA [Janthinobacterium sp. CG_S6]